jgi:TetR/AcrR family transcriptional regulator, lmrAB and yxaGH operons repressor
MASDARERMVASAAVLLAKHGYQGTSFAGVLDASGAPRGSIYHYFPEGKDQLIAAAIELAGAQAISVVASLEGLRPVEIVDGFMAMWQSVLDRSGFSAGCSVLAITVSAESADLVAAAGGVFRAWQQRLGDLLETAGVPADQALGFATLLVAASEGAVALARAQRDLAPFAAVHEQLRSAASRLPHG